MKASMLLVITLVALPGCAGVRNTFPTPDARIQSIDLKSLSLTAVTLLFDVEVDNPYTVSIPVIDIEYALSTGEDRFLEGTGNAHQSIPARGSAVIPMEVRLPFQALIDVGKQVVPGAVIPFRADLTLRVDTPVLGILRVPASRDGEIRIPTVP